MAESTVGIDYLDGWVSRTLRDGRELRVRAFGARALHVPAGNGGLVSAVTIIRNAITRSDAIIKIPSNDPLTAMAIARTLADVAPEPPAHEAPRRRLLEGRRRRGRGAALPPREDREDRRLGRLRLGQARDALHPARARADRARPEAQRVDHRAARRSTSEATLREVALRAATRHRRREPGRLRVRARDLRPVRHRRRGARPGQPARRARSTRRCCALPEHVSTKPKSFDRELRDHLRRRRASAARIGSASSAARARRARSSSRRSTSRSTTHRCSRVGSRTWCRSTTSSA